MAEQPIITHQSAIGRYEQAMASTMPPRIEMPPTSRVSDSPAVTRRRKYAFADARADKGERKTRSDVMGSPLPKLTTRSERSRRRRDEWRDHRVGARNAGAKRRRAQRILAYLCSRPSSAISFSTPSIDRGTKSEMIRASVSVITIMSSRRR